MIRRRSLWYCSRSVSALVILPFALSTCGGEAPAGQRSGSEVRETHRFGGTAVVGIVAELQTMNGLVSSDYLSNQTQQHVLFTTLLEYDSELRPVARFAESWDTATIGADSLELTFHLRRDLRWHDGRLTAADDVAFTYARVTDPATGSPRSASFTEYQRQLERVDSFTVRVRLARHADFLDPWTNLPIMPAHVLEGVPPDELRRHPFGKEEPLGNGPFRFVRHRTNQEWVFEANSDFPPSLGGRPHIDRLIYRIIPDQTTLLIETLTGGVDVNLAVNASQAQRVRKSASAHLLSFVPPQWVYIAWNTRNPLFEDSRVRRALTMAIDRQQIVDGLLEGHADVGRATVSPVHWAYDPEAGVPYDPAAARRLLGEAGWEDRDDDGILEDSSGRPFRFTLLSSTENETRRDLTVFVQSQLSPLGIDVRPMLVEWNTMISRITGTVGSDGEGTRDFDAVVVSWSDGIRKDDRQLLHSRHRGDLYQIVDYGNPHVDALLDSLQLIVHREQARPLWRDYQQLLAREAPMTVLYYPHRLVAVSERMRGVEVAGHGELISVDRWWIGLEGRRNE